MLRKGAMENHEFWCSGNPKNQHACWGCPWLKTIDQSNDPDHWDRDEPALDFRCEALNKHLYSYKAEKSNVLDRLPIWFEDAERMPKECKYKTDPDAAEHVVEERNQQKIITLYQPLIDWLSV
jgi:hypothetical protein